ncbi:hypothetical protein [Nocardia sp. NBC_00511]|uniref:hypothetical protein n=1 Tax=Nocardia sp. NBC_00511 TaxID=2903591 RepID=UPI0030E17188
MEIVTESAPFAVPCISCGSLTQSTLTEALVGDDHRWDIDGHCSACDAVWADCGYTQPMPGFRDAILAANSTAVLELGSVDASAATLMRALRLTRSLSLAQAKALADELRTTGLEGTRIEMHIIARQLHAVGVHTTIRPIWGHPVDRNSDPSPRATDGSGSRDTAHHRRG